MRPSVREGHEFPQAVNGGQAAQLRGNFKEEEDNRKRKQGASTRDIQHVLTQFGCWVEGTTTNTQGKEPDSSGLKGGGGRLCPGDRKNMATVKK